MRAQAGIASVALGLTLFGGSLNFLLSLIILGQHTAIAQAGGPPTNATNLPIGTCTSLIPCANGACCNGKSGLCGFGDKFCTPTSKGGNCTSNCDALAECGDGSAPGKTKCPLNVCCSQFGFCGTGDDFCGDKCQSNCGQPSVPSCGVDEQTALKRRIGYYEGWASTRKCKSYDPEQLEANGLTHINFAFALIDSNFHVVEMTPGDKDLWKRTTSLKSSNPSLQVFLSIGGWTFNDPPTSHRFSDLAASEDNIAAFLGSVFEVIQAYSFDGIDLDWEYPVAKDRGGKDADKANYVNMMKIMKQNLNEFNYGLTFTAPSSYWYLQNFDLPGMMEHVDWVNLMSYDLHGTWDRNDTWIGPIVAAHTNLTEIDAALKLFWRAGVKAEQIVLGLGFYGRSFTLASPECNEPGCIWAGGGNAGPCSDNVGTLMYTEIMDHVDSSGSFSVIDRDAAVVMLTFGGNQWVSYDNKDTFAMKLNYANERCLGGTMVWSLDQDDPDTHDAFKALYPDIDAAASGHKQGGDTCFVAGPGSSSCGPGFSIVETAKDPQGKKHAVCCPSGDMPKSCKWKGDGKRPCSPACSDDEVLIATSSCDSGGAKGLCCKSNINTLEHCQVGDCTDPKNAKTSCPPDYSAFLTTSAGKPKGYCKGNKVRPVCCEHDPAPPIKNCQWVGTPPLCHDNFCKDGQIQVIADKKGDGTQSCSGGKKRAFCCDADGDSYSPVPWDDVFDTSLDLDGDTMTFEVEFDQDQLSDAGNYDSDSNDVGAGTSSPMPDDEDENDEAFGEVFIEAPNPAAVSSVDIHSDWVVTGCSASSDKPQKVLAYCSKSMGASGCAHVFIGGATHTIIQMPKSCGKGPYARVASFEPHPDQSVLLGHGDHHKRKLADESVYALHFDYDFAAIPSENGPIFMRADVTDMPGYWDSVVDSPPSRREWREERGLEPRWWGTFTNWFKKITKVDKDTSVSRNFHWRDSWNIFHAEKHCPGPPAFDGVLDVTLKGKAKFNSRYGFYLQATVVPPEVTAAYLYVKADASASATLTVEGLAKVTYNSDTVQFAKFGFPGLYYPGLLTIGPSLVINGYITGELSLQGTLTTHIEYIFPSLNWGLGKTDQDEVGPSITWGTRNSGHNMAAGYNVELGGDLSIHIVPQVQFGINVLGGKVLDAEAFVRADMFAGIAINGSVSNKLSPQFCWDIYYGAQVDAGLTGSVLYWDTGPHTITFFDERYSAFDKCFKSSDQPSTISSRDELPFISSAGHIPDFVAADAGYGAWAQRNNSSKVVLPRSVSGGMIKRQTPGVSPTPGIFNCPATNDGINTDGNGNQCDIYSEVATYESWDQLNRRSVDSLFTGEDAYQFTNISNRQLDRRAVKSVSVPVCGDPMTAENYDKAVRPIYFDFANPTSATGDPSVTTYNAPLPGSNSNSYGREHIVELQTVADFIGVFAEDDELTPFWETGNNPDFCVWFRNAILPEQVVLDITRCLPYNGAANKKYMPWLNEVMNGIKGAAFSKKGRDKGTFNGYSWTSRVATMRSVAAVLSYMNQAAVQTEFVSESNCIKLSWQRWLARAAALPNAPANAANINIGSIYQDWIKEVVEEFQSTLEESMEDMRGWWRDQITIPANSGITDKDDVPVPVIMCSNQMTCSQVNAHITLRQLDTTLTASLNNNGLTGLVGRL